MSVATLRMLDKAYDEILKLPRAVKGAIYDFQHKFREDPDANGLQLKQLQGNSRLYSARVNSDYRALLLRAGNRDYVLVGVKSRQEVYDNLDRYAYQINPVSGGIEFVDLVTAKAAMPNTPIGPQPLFARYSEDTLLGLGVAAPLLGLIAKITTEDELQGLLEYAPQLTAEVLLELHSGKTPEEVLDLVTASVASEAVDVEDYGAALVRPTTVTTDDVELQQILEEGDFGRWKVFLHPGQRHIVERDFNGPARVSGGPGTGKTIVALHRVARLAACIDSGKVLFTTFNPNLAADLRRRLTDLAAPELMDKVDVVSIDKLAGRVVSESGGPRRRTITDSKAIEHWKQLLAESGECSFDAEFLHDEWTQVVLGQGLATRAEYFQARRTGRGRRISRAARADVWRLVERYEKRLDEANVLTFRQVAERAAKMEMQRAQQNRHRYRHIVVDEAQDLSAAHWRMVRAMVAPGPNDMFIAGDTHQRIYNNYVSLGQLGINIRGRSWKLHLSYRTTHEILGVASQLLGEHGWDDLDEGVDDLAGYRSMLRGPQPTFAPYPTWAAELDGLVEQVRAWEGDSVAVCVPERWMTGAVADRLAQVGIGATAIGADGPADVSARVHVGTMHRFKGVEYRRMFIVGVSEGLVPAARIAELQHADPVRFRQELQRARSLLFVAVTRARDSVVISWHGTRSQFLP